MYLYQDWNTQTCIMEVQIEKELTHERRVLITQAISQALLRQVWVSDANRRAHADPQAGGSS